MRDDPRAEPEDGDGREELSRMTRDELAELAKGEKISGRTKMSKKERVEALSGDR